MKTKNEPKPLAGIFDNYLKMYGLEDKYLTAKLSNNWAEIVGAVLAKNTAELFVQNSLLYIKITSPHLKYELNMLKEKLQEKINNYLEKYHIKDIVIF